MVRTKPVTLGISNKLLYIVHEYPKGRVGETRQLRVSLRQSDEPGWGYLITEDIAPVLVGEGGASLDRWSKNLADAKAWAATIGTCWLVVLRASRQSGRSFAIRLVEHEAGAGRLVLAVAAGLVRPPKQ